MSKATPSASRLVATPTVSIGLPVYNGENWLAVTLDSIARQTLGDYELIISDNASTDATAEICRERAMADSRIRYVRNDENLGAAANYNLVLQLARAPYFKWHAHDDQLAPDCLERSVAALESRPQTVACITGAQRLDGAGHEIQRWKSPLHGTESPDAAVRLGAVVRTFYCHWTEIFSVVRRAAVERTMRYRAFRGTDIAILAELALLGPFVRIDAPLFIHRDHAGRYYNTADHDPAAVLAWYDPNRRGDRVWHKWALYRSHLAAIRRHRLPLPLRLRCHAQLLHSMAMWVNLKGLARDVAWSIDPRLLVAKRRLQQVLFPPPGRRLAR
jgi:glycosyltransferase involved in cell wall biosynthesis